MADLGAFFGNPNLQRQGARARALAEKRDVNTLADPRTYAAVQGLLGTAPDEMGFSVLHPDYQKIRQTAEPAYALGLLGQAAPVLAPLTKGLPVGASIKNVGKFDITKRDASEIFGEGAQRFKYTDPKSGGSIDVLARPDGTASVLELQVPDKFRGKGIGESLQKQVLQDFPDMQGQVSSKAAATTAYRLGRRPVDMPNATLKDVHKMIDEDSSVNLISPQMQERINPSTSYPRQEALDTAQRNAALPIEEGGLGLPKDNTVMDRAKAMGFDIDAFHGSKDPSIMAFDPALVGKSTNNVFDNNIWSTSSPEVARGYSLDTKQFDLLPQTQEIKSKIQDLSKKYKVAYESGKFNEMDNLREQINIAQNESKDLYKSFLKGDIASEDSTIYPLMMRSSDFMPYEAEGKNWMRVNAKAIDEAKQQGYGGVQIKNVSDNTQASDGIRSNTYATENPELIRSRFAAFDPMRRNEADILAGVLPLGLLADEEQRKKLYELMPSLLGQ
jgi:predicted GNAT family acetyltransferase